MMILGRVSCAVVISRCAIKVVVVSGCLGKYVVVCVYLGVVICTVGSLGLVEFVCGYLGGFLGLLVMSAVWRESTSDFGQFFPFVAIPR